MRKSIAVMMAVAGIVVGAAGGYAVAASTVEPETIIETETVTQTVEVTPQSCTDALDAAAAVHLLLIDKWTTAVGAGAPSDLEELLADLDSLSDVTDLDSATDRWWDTRQACLDTAQ